MLVTWRHRERRGSLIQSLDPRAWWIFYACFLASTLLFWDARFLAVFLAIALFFIFTSRVTWQESRRAWLFIGLFITFFAILTFLTGRGGVEVYQQEHLITRLQAPFSIFGWQPGVNITVERSFFALSQFLRVFSIASLTILIPYSLDPGLYGVAFRGLGLPDKIAYAMDLTMRFIPTFGRDFQLTLDAQRARGYEIENLRGGLIAQVRKMAPLIVPVTIHAIIGSEDIIDAMDLRAFGVGPRTWLQQLHYRRRDRLLIVLGVLLLTASLGLSFSGLGKFWVPAQMLENRPLVGNLTKEQAMTQAQQECLAAYDESLSAPHDFQARQVTLKEAYAMLGNEMAFEQRPPDTPVWIVWMKGAWRVEPPGGSYSQDSDHPPIVFQNCTVILPANDQESLGGVIVTKALPQ
jgi:energy-coupling factor transport system permease protein